MRVLLLLACVVLVAGLTVILGLPVSGPVSEDAAQPVAPPAQTATAAAPDSASSGSVIGERQRPATEAEPSAPATPVPSPAAVAALREGMAHGDPRTPPIVRQSHLREPPTEAELADPELYQQYELRQKQQVYAFFVEAAGEKIRVLEGLIARGKREGIDPQQLAEGEHKLARLREQRDQLIEQHPELAPDQPAGDEAQADAGSD
ncbi:hypothetical protein A11A3_01917 [Alcanivorax hongdengensis A-11-3]|uniref:Uncharacterized protein n=1 Tax=Alcanivorax hongdengensis A-11-3 TaxID=1177179 RepID=L0WFG0_9GAMM|nr:hypothetical protein [Alcanivorax hongdengensis]EKF75588.1 hypothetical protein A11A3_01917 [Alcanivorax hongdengensis A-11-3]